MQSLNGTLYGTTLGGGSQYRGTIFDIKTSGGVQTELYNFCSLINCEDGSEPAATSIRGADNNFYGTTTYGGTGSVGTVFEVTPDGTFTSMHSFDRSEDGGVPNGGLVQATDGNYLRDDGRLCGQIRVRHGL
ncbi:MAG: choice-of-anchor tandem repeat GloVer-containing protein [Candidatus Sulfotelmatobacter sp.]